MHMFCKACQSIIRVNPRNIINYLKNGDLLTCPGCSIEYKLINKQQHDPDTGEYFDGYDLERKK